LNRDVVRSAAFLAYHVRAVNVDRGDLHMQKDDLARLALFASVMSIAPDGIITVNEEQLIIYFNEGAERIFGYRREEVVGRPIGLLLPERFRATHAEHIRNFAVSRVAARLMGERQEISGLHKDGHEFPAEAAICQLAIGQHRIFTVLIRDITDLKRREMHTQMLMRELEHRVHNVLARVQIVIEHGAGGQSSLQEFQQSLLARIHSMTHAHQLLQRSNWFGVSIKDLVADQLKPYATNHNNRIDGPEILLNPDATQAMSMVVHELTTNAAKYGALSVPEGHIMVSWEQEPERGLILRWIELDGPEVKMPQRSGYGTTLIRDLLSFEFGGTVDHRFLPGGVTCEISLPLERSLAA
jgi:PAS domain S-box-containing protein